MGKVIAFPFHLVRESPSPILGHKATLIVLVPRETSRAVREQTLESEHNPYDCDYLSGYCEICVRDCPHKDYCLTNKLNCPCKKNKH